MKKTKALLSVVISVVLLLTLIVPCFAKQSDYDYLINLGFSREMLDNMPKENYTVIREMIADNDVSNVSYEKYYMNETSNARGAISENDLELQISIGEICAKGTDIINLYLVTATWVWAENKPINKLNDDAITINWNAELLNIAVDGFYARDWYKESENGEEIIAREITTPAEAAQGGIGFYTNTENWKKYVGGSVILLLETSVPMYTGNEYSSTINLEYAHDYSAPIIGGIGFTVKVFSVDFDFETMVDTMATFNNIYYST